MKSILEELSEKFWKNFVGKGLEMATRGPIKFGFHSAHVRQEKLRVKFIMASRLNHANFLAGTIDSALCRIFEKKYTFKIICNKKESKEFDEYVLLCFDVTIIRDKSESNTANIKRKSLKMTYFQQVKNDKQRKNEN